MLAGNIMDVQIKTLRPSDPASEAVRIILETGVGEVAVVDLEGALLGVVSEAALLKAMPFYGPAPGSGQKNLSISEATAADFLEKDFFNLPPETPLSGVAELFAATGKRAAVVFILDAGGRLLGGISAQDLLKREWKNPKKKEEKGK
ncbi:MAG: HPP family protein [Thermodesulfobacteriota bacterium]